MNKLERTLFYPVVVIATLLAFGSWSLPDLWISLLCTVAVAALWLHPVFKGRFALGVRVVFWLTLIGVFLSLVWVFVMSGLLIPS